MREPRSREEWQEYFRNQAARRPDWNVLPIEVLFSRAFLEGLKPKAQLALLYGYTQVEYQKRSKRDRTNNKRRRWTMTKADVYLPTNALAELGIESSATQTKVRNSLVQTGFLDVVKSGSFLNPGHFRLSDRWRQYPDGDYRPKDLKPAGRSMGYRFPAAEDKALFKI